MNKMLMTILVMTAVVLAGYFSYQLNQTPEQSSNGTQENHIFENESFSLTLPTPYVADTSIIQPKNENAFPIIQFSHSKENIAVNNLRNFSEEWLDQLCGQTDVCGKMISSETTMIGNKNGLKFTVQYLGRSAEDKNGYINEYHWVMINEDNLFQFWTSASDLENPDEINKKFYKIMETISFK